MKTSYYLGNNEMDDDFQIHELAERAGVSVRTIRFYIDEGLLPPPPVKGRYTVYSDEYLELLELIRRLKERFLPLREIRQRMAGLGRQEVQQALAQEQPDQQRTRPQERVARPGGEGGSSALDYINRLLKGGPESSAGPFRPGKIWEMNDHYNFGTEPAAPEVRRYGPGQPDLAGPPAEDRPKGLPTAEAWERLELAPGVELHIRQPLDAQRRLSLQKLVELARRLFS